MKHILLILVIFVFIKPVISQGILKGKILYQNSGNKPAVGVAVKGSNTDATNQQYTTANGSFILRFNNKKVGDEVFITIGTHDATMQAIELVNEKELGLYRIPSDSAYEYKIIVCKKGQKDEARRYYYNILESATTKFKQRKNTDIDSLIPKNRDNQSKLEKLIAEKDSLQKAFRIMMGSLYDQAEFIAKINLDMASQMVKEAIAAIKEERDIEKALKILDPKKLDKMDEENLKELDKEETKKKLAEENIENLGESIKQSITARELRIPGLISKFQYKEGINTYLKIIEIYQRISTGSSQDLKKMANWCEKIASFYYLDGKYYQALDWYGKAINKKENIKDLNPLTLADTYSKIATVCRSLYNYTNALEYSKKDLAIKEKYIKHNDTSLAETYNDIGITLLNLGEYGNSDIYLTKAIELKQAYFRSKDHPSLANSYNNIAILYSKSIKDEFSVTPLQSEPQKKPAYSPSELEQRKKDSISDRHQREKTIEYHMKAILIAEKKFGYNHPEVADFYSDMGGTYWVLKEYQKALEYQKKCLLIRKTILDPSHPDLGRSFSIIAAIYYKMKGYEQALAFQKKAVQIFSSIFPEEHIERKKANKFLDTIAIGAKENEKSNEFETQSAIPIQK